MFSPDGMICGPSRPVKGFQVHMASPVMSAPRFSTVMTALPGVCTGVCTTRGVHALAYMNRAADLGA
jgi:hypothetical protein